MSIKTIGELIKELSKYPQDMEIGIDNSDFQYIKSIRKERSEEEHSNEEWLEIELE